MSDKDRELLQALAIDNPWSWSTEGLDDCCMFCHAEDRHYSSKTGYRYVHCVDCVWLEAREHLGLQQPGHERGTDLTADR